MLYKTMAGAIRAKYKKEKTPGAVRLSIVRAPGSRYYRLARETSTMRRIRSQITMKQYGRKTRKPETARA